MQLIADILSFNTNQEALSEQFKHKPTDWDAVVIVASQHLMLPALYCQIKAKDLLHLIPEDLQLYLEEITAINRGRNEVLLKEVHEISEILKKEQIDHVFIKGTALLASDVFKDPAERMIGDIDILVEFYKERKTLRNYIDFCETLEGLFANFKIDIVTKFGLSPFIGPHILKEVDYVKI